MDWKPSGYKLSTQDLVHAIFDKQSDAGKMLIKACSGDIELFAAHKSWNAILWLITSTIKADGESVYSGDELGKLKSSLPISWHKKV